MEREINMEEISDGKAYRAGDLVKIGCMDCKGCHSCCTGMGKTIILDPYDLFQLEKNLKQNMMQLLENYIELNVVDGLIQPNLKMQEKTDACAFLNQDGRCSIHTFRPGFCRMFPMGRLYEEGTFSYFLQVHECPYPDKTKVKLKKWLEIPELTRYEGYISSWHYFLKDVLKTLTSATEEESKKINLFLLNYFFINSYDTEGDFYQQFEERLEKAKAEVTAL